MPFLDVVAYVEVYSGSENRSACICTELRNLGATVVQKLTNKVTHLVFCDGKQASLERARLRNIHIVSTLWVDRCVFGISVRLESLNLMRIVRSYGKLVAPILVDEKIE